RFAPVWLKATCAAFGALGVVSLWSLAIRGSKRTGADIVEIGDVRDEGESTATFLASYLLPFLTIQEPTASDIVAYVLFLAIAAIVYVRSDTAQVNPTLYLFGYRGIWLRTTGGWSGFALVKRMPQKGGRLRKVNLAGHVLIEVPGDR